MSTNNAICTQFILLLSAFVLGILSGIVGIGLIIQYDIQEALTVPVHSESNR